VNETKDLTDARSELALLQILFMPKTFGMHSGLLSFFLYYFLQYRPLRSLHFPSS
jgi:hypothetical protein